MVDELAEPVVLEGEPDEHGEREGEDAGDHEHARADQRIGKEVGAQPGAIRAVSKWGGRLEVRRRDRHSHRASPLYFYFG